MPTPVLFTVFSFLLRVMEGTGTAMFTTVSYTLRGGFRIFIRGGHILAI